MTTQLKMYAYKNSISLILSINHKDARWFVIDDVVLQSSYANLVNISVFETFINRQGFYAYGQIDLKSELGHFYHILENSGRWNSETNFKMISCEKSRIIGVELLIWGQNQPTYLQYSHE